MHYLNWAKTHERVRHELTGSGVPRARLDDFGGDRVPVSLEAKGDYGDPALVDAIATRYGVPVESILPVPGASSANFIAVAVSAASGEAVMIERPAYDPLGRIAAFLGLRVIPLERAPEDGFAVDLDALEAGLERGAKAVILTNLHNPTGRHVSLEMVGQIAQTCARADATLIVDEVYLDGVALSGRTGYRTAAGVARNVITTSSLTKVYGLDGLRVGWLIGNPAVIEQARDVMDLLSVVNASPSMSLAVQAFAEMEELEERYRRLYEDGQAVFREWLKGEPLIRAYESFGALFECVRLPDGVDADRFIEYLVTEHDTRVVPGSFFGLDGHVRISIAPPGGNLAEGLACISAALRTYRSSTS